MRISRFFVIFTPFEVSGAMRKFTFCANCKRIFLSSVHIHILTTRWKKPMCSISRHSQAKQAKQNNNCLKINYNDACLQQQNLKSFFNQKSFCLVALSFASKNVYSLLPNGSRTIHEKEIERKWHRKKIENKMLNTLTHDPFISKCNGICKRGTEKETEREEEANYKLNNTKCK